MENGKIVEEVARSIWETEFGSRTDGEWAFLWGNEHFRFGVERRAQAAIRTHLSALAKAGFIVVPKEPTEEMMDCGGPWAVTARYAESPELGARNVYVAMIASKGEGVS